MSALRYLFFLFPLTAPALELPLSQIAARVKSHHPQLRAARMAVEQARARQLGSGRLANPTLDTSFQNESAVSPRTASIGIDQAFPLTRRLTLEKQLSAQLVTAAEFEVQDASRRLIADARTLAVRIMALDQQSALRQQQVRLPGEPGSFAKKPCRKRGLSTRCRTGPSRCAAPPARSQAPANRAHQPPRAAQAHARRLTRRSAFSHWLAASAGHPRSSWLDA
ncbi:MAG: TolC family protein [Verrucomicrobiaceae bacterium]|nr:TolC family protein [Verrucomicrobiaceae bacterium]